MSSPHSQLNSGVCVVGYALNAKKLRKSSHDRSLVSDCSPISGHAKTFASNSETAPKRKLSDVEACYIEHEWKGGGLADILESNSSSSPAGKDRSAVLFVQLDHEIPLENQPKCHVIIHKLTEDIDNKSKDSVAKIKSLDAYLQHNPDTVIVDPLLAVRKVISRARTCEHLSIIQRQMQGKCPFTQPAYGIVKESASTEDIVRQISDLRFCYPLICKPIQACGTPNSHNMVRLCVSIFIFCTVHECLFSSFHSSVVL